MTEGDSETLVATVKPDDATDKTVTWSTSDKTIATVENGKVTAVLAGEATITAKAGEKEATCKVVVSKKVIPVSSVELNKASLALTEGDSETLVATVKPDDATDKTVTWSSSDEKIATVENGKVSAIKEGSVTITATAGDKKATCKVTVQKKIVAVASVSLSQTAITLYEGQSTTLVATVKPDDATNKTVTWSSSNSEVATVDASGKVTAVAGGITTITAKAGDQQATCDVTVAVPVESVTLDKTTLSLEEGDSITLSATVAPEDATDKTITWSCANTNIATVNQNGKVTAIAKGQTIVTAKAGDQSATCEITVFPPIESVTLNQSSIKLDKGQTTTLVATVNPDDVLDKTVTWSSSKSSIASVSQDGVVTAIAGGEAVITASAGGKTAKCTVTVNVPVESIKLNYSEKTIVVGDKFSLSATISPSNATDKTVTWFSDHPDMASVDNGSVLAIKKGQATITASSGNAMASCLVTVINEEDLDLEHKVSISPQSGYGIAIVNGRQYIMRTYKIYNKSIVDIYVYKVEAPYCSLFSYQEEIGMGITYDKMKSIGSAYGTISAGKSVELTLYFTTYSTQIATIHFRHNGYEYQVSGGN